MGGKAAGGVPDVRGESFKRGVSVEPNAGGKK